MPRFLIELDHEAETVACARAVQLLQQTGSHFLTNADYGCHDGVHKAWFIIEAENRGEARTVLPPVVRDQARIVGLNKFSMDEIDELLKHHSDKR
jgi:hypothetical protein